MTTAYPDSYLQEYFDEAHNGYLAIFHLFWPPQVQQGKFHVIESTLDLNSDHLETGNKIPTGTITSCVIFQVI